MPLSVGEERFISCDGMLLRLIFYHGAKDLTVCSRITIDGVIAKQETSPKRTGHAIDLAVNRSSSRQLLKRSIRISNMK